MTRYADTVTDQYDNPVAGVQVTVLDADDAVAALTNDAGTTLLNPVATDALGVYYFNAPEGTYTLQYRLSPTLNPFRVRAVVLNDDHTLRVDLSDNTGASLIGTSTGDTVQEALDGRLTRVATRTALAALPSSVTYAYLTEAGREGLFKWTTGDQSANVTLDTQQAVYVAPASATSGASGAWVRQYQGALNILWFGAVGDGVTNNQGALSAARTYLNARKAASGQNTEQLVWPAGRYNYVTSPNWGIERLRMHFEGEVWLNRTGTGPAFILDGGSSGGGLLGLQITGYPYINEDGTANHAIYIRAIHNSNLQFRSTGAGAGYSVLKGEWLVDNDISFVASGLEGGLYKIPDYGLHLTSRGVNEQSAYNRVRVRISGEGGAGNKMPVGAFLDGALGNLLFGTLQNCDLAYTDTTNAWENKITADFEANTVDAEVHGQHTQFFWSEFEIGPVFAADSIQCKMEGGATQNLTVQSGASRTVLSTLTYNRLRVPGTGTLTIGDASTRMRDLTNGKTGEVHNAPRAEIDITIGASPFRYDNTTGNAQTVIIYGGTVSSVDYARFAGRPLPVAGAYELSPGDGIIVTYSSVPAMVVITR